MDNPEKLATLSTQYTGRRKITNKKKPTTIQQYTQTNTNNINNT